MARAWRIQFEGAVYHLTMRGNARQDIFLEDGDRKKFLDLVRRTCEQYHFEVLAFCLMNNHVHLFLRTPEANLSAGMHWLNTTYTGWFNWRHQRIGHLFQGRFKSILLLYNEHYRHLSMYIHLNAVRAGLVEHPADYPWSSFRDYTSPQSRYPWLNRDELLEHYRVRGASRFKHYLRECLALIGRQPEFVEGLKKSVAVAGPPDRVRALLNRHRPAGKLAEIPGYRKTALEFLDLEAELKKVAELFGVNPEDLRRKRRNFPPRLAAYYHLVMNCRMTCSAAAQALALSCCAVSKGIARLQKRLAQDAFLHKKLESLSFKSRLDPKCRS